MMTEATTIISTEPHAAPTIIPIWEEEVERSSDMRQTELFVTAPLIRHSQERDMLFDVVLAGQIL